jgi:transcriptional regulator with XRE-family HTH domain
VSVPDVAQRLAVNLRRLRESRGLTQEQAARLAELPRPTWATLESGSANPTLAVLLGVAAALQVSLEELVGPPRATGTLYPAAALRARRRGAVTVRDLLPEKVPGMEIERMEIPRGAVLNGIPHTPGTREYLACEAGRIELATEGQTYALAPGDVVVFRGDQRHSYRNTGRESAVGYSVVVMAPVAG